MQTTLLIGVWIFKACALETKNNAEQKSKSDFIKRPLDNFLPNLNDFCAVDK